MIGALRWGERGEQKRDCFGEYTSCRVAFEGKTVISPIVQSPGSDCQTTPRNPASSISTGQTERSSHKNFFFKNVCEALNCPGLSWEVKVQLEKLKIFPTSSFNDAPKILTSMN